MSMEKHPLHIKNPELQKSEEVQDAVEKKERLAIIHNEALRDSGVESSLEKEKIPNDPNERIEVYMDRLENVFLNPDEKTKQRNLEMLRPKIYDTLIIKPENFPESFFELQRRVAREQGHGDVEITPEMRERMIETSIEDQKHSLNAWINYLTSDDAVYPTWFKYYAWTQITKLSQFDKERGEFKRRTDKTVAPFPDIYREPLAQLCDLYEKVKEDNKALKDEEIREIFSKKFPSAYAEFIQKSLASQIEKKEGIEGEWIKYEQGDMSQAERLFNSLESKGTGWCTAGKSTAETQIKSGDFYVYYTNDEHGEPTQPRLAIRMNGKDQISEIRGILPHQNIEPIMQDVLNQKLEEFGQEADAYRKKSEDMKKVTALEHKQEKGEPFTIEELLFIYQVDSSIESFGYDEDPRIYEILQRRNTSDDTLALAHHIAENKDRFPKEISEQAEGTLQLQQISANPEIIDKDLLIIYQIESPITALPYDKKERLEKVLANRDSEKDYTVISNYVLNNPEQFSDDHKKKAQDTIRLYEMEHKLEKKNEAELTRADLIFLYEIESPTKTFNMDLLRGVNELKRKRSKYGDARILAVKNTELLDRVQKSVPLTKEDFEYLFELNGQKIEEYLNEHDDRVDWMLQKIDLKNNLYLMFECLPEEVAYTPKQINENTKVWAGKITNGVLEKLPDGITHIHGEFPRYMYMSSDYRSQVQGFFERNYAKRLPYERKHIFVKEKIKNKDSLDKDDLMYLYEMDNRNSIINHEEELQTFRHKRNSEEDMLVIFDCSKEEIAHNVKEITEKTKIYVGKFEQNLFNKLPESIEHIYRDFSWYVDHRYEAKIEKVQIGGKTKRELIRELETSDFKISDYARELIAQAPTSSPNQTEPTEVTFVTVTCGAFGLEKSEFTTPHYSELERRAMDAGLSRCSTEAALTYILDKKPEHNLRVAITDPFGKGVLSAHREYKKTNYILGSDSSSLEAGWYRFLFRVS